MRKSQEVILEGMEPVRMLEMTVSHFPAAMRLLKRAISAQGEITTDAAMEILLDHYDEALQILVDCSNLSEEEFRKVGGSDLIEIIQGWVNANDSFFEKVQERLPGAKTAVPQNNG